MRSPLQARLHVMLTMGWVSQAGEQSAFVLHCKMCEPEHQKSLRGNSTNTAICMPSMSLCCVSMRLSCSKQLLVSASLVASTTHVVKVLAKRKMCRVHGERLTSSPACLAHILWHWATEIAAADNALHRSMRCSLQSFSCLDHHVQQMWHVNSSMTPALTIASSRFGVSTHQ